MADLQIIVAGPDTDKAADLLKVAVLDAGSGAAVSRARPAGAAGPPRRAVDPLPATTLILTAPGAILSVNTPDITDRIRKRRKAQALIDAAERLQREQGVQTFLIAADGTLHSLARLTADALLEIAEEVNRAASPPPQPPLPVVAERGPLRGNGAPQRMLPLLDQAEYPVWYGTNRRPLDPANHAAGYSSARDTAVHYGRCRVYIPAAHKIGSTGSPWWKRLLAMADDRLRLLSVETRQAEAFWRSVAAHLAEAPVDERSAVVFIHGYNVSFEAAALRAAQIGFDLSVKGAMAFFSWPSRGTLDGYLADAAAIEASEDAIADFMVDFVERSGAQAVHIIAHSMGNRGVLRAVDRIAAQAQQRTGARFGQVILAAADVDADVFRRLSAAYAKVARRTTLYVSGRDLAVEASRWLHGFPRAGLLPPVLVAPRIDTVNVTNADLTMLGHGYVADARDVLRDMHALIMDGAPPEKRFSLREGRNENGERFWLIGA